MRSTYSAGRWEKSLPGAKPGSTTLTRILCGASSSAWPLDSRSSAVLDMQYVTEPVGICRAAPDPILTNTPGACCAIISLAIACVTRNGARTLTDMMRSNSASARYSNSPVRG